MKVFTFILLLMVAGNALTHPTNYSGNCYPDPTPWTGFKYNSPDYVLDKEIGDTSTGCALISYYDVSYDVYVSGIIKNMTIMTVQTTGQIYVDLKNQSDTYENVWIGRDLTYGVISNETAYITKNANRFNKNGTVTIKLYSPYSNLVPGYAGGFGQYVNDLSYEVEYFSPPTTPELSESHGLNWISLNWSQSMADTNTSITYSISRNGEFLANISENSYNISDLSQGTDYLFSVVVTDSYNLASQPAILTVRTDSAPAPAPVFYGGGSGGGGFSMPSPRPVAKIEEVVPVIENETEPIKIFEEENDTQSAEQPTITAAATESNGNIYYGVLSAVLGVLAVSFKKIKNKIAKPKKKIEVQKKPLRQITMEEAENEVDE